jgi:glycosyltransferase involved in cell wall biosynthesis
MMNDSRPILISGSTSWYLWNFRRNVIAALVEAGWEVLAVAPEDEHSERLAAMPGVRWIDWQLALDGANPLEELSSLLRFASIVHRTRPRFILNHGIKPNVYGGLVSRFRSIPYANSVTGLGMMLTRSGVGPRTLGKLLVFACNRARALFIQNYEDLEVLRGIGLSNDVDIIRTMGSGVDLSRFAFAAMPPASPERVFLFVGRLQQDKGIGDFIEAARKLRREFPLSHFVVVGSRRHANRQAVADDVLRDWNDEGIVEFVGHQEDVRPWLEACHALVLPSHGGEGIPRVMLEAAAVGRPTIASDVPGCRDAIVAAKTGYLHPPRDGEALLAAMRTLCEATDDDLAMMGRAARADAEARFSDHHLVEATLAMLDAC